MTTALTGRQIALGCALAATIVVTLVFGESNPPVPQPAIELAVASPAKVRAMEVEKPARIEIEKLSRMPPATGGTDLFAPKSWALPKAAARERVQPVPVPAAPPLPFEYIGQMEGREGLVASLAREGEVLFVKAGDRIGSDYRLESVSPEALTFVYLPLDERQTLQARVP